MLSQSIVNTVLRTKGTIVLLKNRTDEELMVMYQRGAEDAFKILYERYASKVYGFLITKIHNQEKANDIFQEVFVRVHKSKQLYNKTLPFAPWLFAITKNALIDEIRKTAKEKDHLQIEEVIIAAPGLVVAPQLSEALPYLRLLPENQKRAVELRYIEEKTFEEISEILKTSPVNVRKLISRGVQRVKELLREGDKP